VLPASAVGGVRWSCIYEENRIAVASTRVQSWGDVGPKEVGCGEGCSPPHQDHGLPTGQESWRGQIFLFCDLKWRILVNSVVLNLKFFFIVSSLSGVWVDCVANFGFLSKTMNKRHHKMLSLGEDD